MERLQQLANHSFYGEPPDMESFDKVLGAYGLKLLFEQEEQDETMTCSATNLSLPNYSTMPFLQMLQNTELDSVRSTAEALFKLDPLKNQPWEMESQIMTMDFESCVTQETVAQQHQQQQQPHYSTCCSDGLSPTACEKEEPVIESFGNSRGSTSPAIGTRITSSEKDHLLSKSVPLSKEKRQRKRSKRPTKNEDEVESQRMTHIAVERNRRRQMNEHLNTLRALMPPSYIQRGDQASIIGGAINFVKELEQLLESQQTQKRMRMNSMAKEETEESSGVLTNEGNCSEGLSRCCGLPVESSKSVAATAEIDVTVIQTHVNLRIQCEKRTGQLLKAIIALEDLRLTVLHLNITSSENLIHYTFNLKIEEDCTIGSADEIARAVHQIFNFINGF